MWTSAHVIQALNINMENLNDNAMRERLRSLEPILWTTHELTSLGKEQMSIATLRKNNFTYREISVLSHITSHNTISAVLKYTACGIPFILGRQGGHYSIFSPTLRHYLTEYVHFRRRSLNCLKTHEAKEIILEVLENIKQTALERLKEWKCINLINGVIQMFTESTLTNDILSNLCYQCNIFILSGETLELVRRKCCNLPAIEHFYSIITDLVANYSPAYKFNADETGLSSKRIFKILTEDRHLRITAQGNQLPHISCMLCFSEAGAKLPPFFIFPKHNADFRELSEIPDIFYASSQTGWMTSHLWSVWCILFVSYITMKRDAKQLQNEVPVILFVDGHTSRHDPFGLRLLNQFNVICIVFPAHCTHVIQPFDVCLGSPLKAYYIQESVSRIITHIDNSDFTNAEMIRRQRVIAFINAWNRISIPLMQKAFQFAGLGHGCFGIENMQHRIARP